MSGTEHDVKKCLEEIQQKIGGGGGGDRRDRNEYSADGGDEYKETLTFEPGKVGRIIGAGGATISALQSDHNVKVNISKEDDEVSLHYFNEPTSSKENTPFSFRMANAWSKLLEVKPTSKSVSKKSNQR